MTLHYRWSLLFLAQLTRIIPCSWQAKHLCTHPSTASGPFFTTAPQLLHTDRTLGFLGIFQGIWSKVTYKVICIKEEMRSWQHFSKLHTFVFLLYQFHYQMKSGSPVLSLKLFQKRLFCICSAKVIPWSVFKSLISLR